MAVSSRKPGSGTLFHSDRGSRYGLTASMSGKGDCWENAVVESFSGTMKTELGDPIWPSKDAARAAIFDDVETCTIDGVGIRRSAI